MNIAVLVVDMQNDFFKKESLLKQKDLLVKNINSLLGKARESKVPVIWVRQILKADLSNSPKHIKEFGKGKVLEGTTGSELVDGLKKQDSDLEITKTRYSGFFRTNLEDTLNRLGVDTVVICGVNTHACIRMTAIDAYQRDYDVVVAKDCVASWDEEHHKMTLRYFEPVIAKVKNNEEIYRLLK